MGLCVTYAVVALAWNYHKPHAAVLSYSVVSGPRSVAPFCP